MPPLLFYPLYLVILLLCILVAFYAERKVAAFIQDRLGPMEAGKYGTLQAVADLLKLLQKEDNIPDQADRPLFQLAPLFLFLAVITGFAVVPFAYGWQPSGIDIGVFFLFAVVSLDVIGLLMAGWASNSKYALFGSLRAVAQIVSYEIPLGLVVLAVIAYCGTAQLNEIGRQQGIFAQTGPYLLGLKALGVNLQSIGGLPAWNIVRAPWLLIGFLIYYMASLAEANRAPFDLPEAESELVGGFHTEYSGFRWSLFFLAEYAMMLLVAAVGVILFFGAWYSPLPNLGPAALADWTNGQPGHWSAIAWGLFWFLGKVLLWVFTQIWVRWTLPRLRVDQLMHLGWKVLTPFGLGLVLVCAVWRLLQF